MVEEQVQNTPEADIYSRIGMFNGSPKPVLIQWAYSTNATIVGFVIRIRM